MNAEQSSPSPIVYSCYFRTSRAGEHFVADHILSYLVSGALTITDARQQYTFGEGDCMFIRRNQLASYTKQPRPNGEYKTISIYFDQATLRELGAAYGYASRHPASREGIVRLKNHRVYKGFMDSLLPYLEADPLKDPALMALKRKEALLTLLKVNPELEDVLFDFSAPGKIDLEGFMQKNFRFKAGLSQFAYLTGRSLATFKRDFEKVFNTSPGRWLVQRRLEEAYHQIREGGKRPSEVYYELGFEDFSHFSYAFRQAFGQPPSRIGKTASRTSGLS
jgi:AraC-like DNA-binding protein